MIGSPIQPMNPVIQTTEMSTAARIRSIIVIEPTLTYTSTAIRRTVAGRKTPRSRCMVRAISVFMNGCPAR